MNMSTKLVTAFLTALALSSVGCAAAEPVTAPGESEEKVARTHQELKSSCDSLGDNVYCTGDVATVSFDYLCDGNHVVTYSFTIADHWYCTSPNQVAWPR